MNRTIIALVLMVSIAGTSYADGPGGFLNNVLAEFSISRTINKLERLRKEIKKDYEEGNISPAEYCKELADVDQQLLDLAKEQASRKSLKNKPVRKQEALPPIIPPQRTFVRPSK